MPLLGKVPLTMPLREHADGGVPLVIEDPDDPAAQAIRQVARGLIALAPPARCRCLADSRGRRRGAAPRRTDSSQTRGHVAADGLTPRAARASDMPLPQARRSARGRALARTDARGA